MSLPTLNHKLNEKSQRTTTCIKHSYYRLSEEVFVYLQSAPNFLFGYIYKRNLNIKIKNSARAKSEKLAFIYTLRFIHKTVVCHLN